MTLYLINDVIYVMTNSMENAIKMVKPTEVAKIEEIADETTKSLILERTGSLNETLDSIIKTFEEFIAQNPIYQKLYGEAIYTVASHIQRYKI